MKRLALLLCMLPCYAQADIFAVTWQLPTTYVNGDPLLPEDIQSIILEYSICNPDGTYSNTEGSIEIDGTLTSYAFNVPDTGTICIRAFTKTVNGAVSMESNIAVAVSSGPTNPIEGLAVGSDLTVYALIQSIDTLTLLPVGQMPEGTPCDASQSINGFYVVPRDSVLWAGSVRSEVVVAECVGS